VASAVSAERRQVPHVSCFKQRDSGSVYNSMSTSINRHFSKLPVKLEKKCVALPTGSDEHCFVSDFKLRNPLHMEPNPARTLQNADTPWPLLSAFFIHDG
jgi:hypothetical protein